MCVLEPQPREGVLECPECGRSLLIPPDLSLRLDSLSLSPQRQAPPANPQPVEDQEGLASELAFLVERMEIEEESVSVFMPYIY